jgi:hypothetical protein
MRGHRVVVDHLRHHLIVEQTLVEKLTSVTRAWSGMVPHRPGFTLFEVHPDHRAAARCAREHSRCGSIVERMKRRRAMR